MLHPTKAKTLLLSSLLVASCSSETRESEKRREAEYDDGYRIEVLKKDSYTSYKGLLTGHDYGVRHEYAYSFELSPTRVAWSGGAAEPKALVICGDQIYLRYLDIELEARKQDLDAGVNVAADAALREQAVEPARTVKAVARQAKLRDERTFFKLFGAARWINVEPGDLPIGSGCREHTIPNDNELALGKPVLEP